MIIIKLLFGLICFQSGTCDKSTDEQLCTTYSCMKQKLNTDVAESFSLFLAVKLII